MAAELKPKLTFDEYLEIESKTEFKSEFVNGEIYALAGASPERNIIAANVMIEIGKQIQRPHCAIYSGDQLLKVPARETGRYPDVIVVCGEPQYHKSAFLNALLNPTLLVEVLSPTTEPSGRNTTQSQGRNIKVGKYRKAEEYRSIPSLKEYLLIAQSRYHVEHYSRRAENQWLLSEYNGLQSMIRLAAINCELSLAEIYKMVPSPEAR
jgi:Uma2 family endonuclease